VPSDLLRLARGMRAGSGTEDCSGGEEIVG